MAAWKKIFRPYRSPSFPHSGVETVEANRYAVTTQVRWEAPCRSPTMVGSAVDTTVWSRAARNMPSIRAPMMMWTWRFGRLSGPAVVISSVTTGTTPQRSLAAHANPRGRFPGRPAPAGHRVVGTRERGCSGAIGHPRGSSPAVPGRRPDPAARRWPA